MKKQSSGFGASLIELIVAVAVFSIIAAQCVQIFVFSTELSNNSADLSRAVILAESAAESFRATGDCGKTAELIGGDEIPDGFIAFYDDFSPAEESKASLILIGALQDLDGLSVCDISVHRSDGSEIFSVSVAGWEVAS